MAHLSVHTVIFSDSIRMEYRSKSTSRHSHLFSVSFSKHSHSKKENILPNTMPQMSTKKSTIDADNYFQSEMSNIGSSKDHRSRSQHSTYSRSISCPSIKPHQSMKNTFTNIWQEFNQNPSQSSNHSKRPVCKKQKNFSRVIQRRKSNRCFRLNFDGELLLRSSCPY